MAFQTVTEYNTIEMWDERSLKGVGYYQNVRHRLGSLPEACPHKHLSERDAKKCRDFLPDDESC